MRANYLPNRLSMICNSSGRVICDRMGKLPSRPSLWPVKKMWLRQCKVFGFLEETVHPTVEQFPSSLCSNWSPFQPKVIAMYNNKVNLFLFSKCNKISILSNYLFLIVLFTYYLFGLHWVFSTAHGFPLVALLGEPSLWGMQASVVAARGLSSCVSQLSCPAAHGIFLDQGSNLCPLHWQADS